MINWSRVAELREEIGAEDFEDVAELFLTEVAEGMETLLSRTDPSDLHQDLHFLKGSALSLGFEEFATLCQDGETLSSNGRGSDVDLTAITRSFRDSRDLFLSECAQRLSRSG